MTSDYKNTSKGINLFADCVSEGQLQFWDLLNVQTQPNELRVLSLFSGCGGMDLGFEGGFICHRKSIPADSAWLDAPINDNWVLLRNTRFKTVFANDILPEASVAWLNYMKRFKVNPLIYHTESIVDLVKLHQKGSFNFPRNIDVVTGGFPCQDFSVAGKRRGFASKTRHDGTKGDETLSTEESRGKLYYWMKKVIGITKPKIFIAENVKGLVNLGDVKDIIQKDFASADGDGYIVLPPRVLHAGNYGVPETRERVFFIGMRKSALRPEMLRLLESDNLPDKLNPYPPPSHDHTGNHNVLLPPVTCNDVFVDLKEPHESSDLSQIHYSRAKYMGKHCQGQTEIQINSLGPTIRSEHHGNIEFRRLSAKHGGVLDDELNAGLLERRLTPRECALIQTFPPDYPFVQYKPNSRRFALAPSGAYRVIGNAVPPMLAFNIATRLQELWETYFE